VILFGPPPDGVLGLLAGRLRSVHRGCRACHGTCVQTERTNVSVQFRTGRRMHPSR
jgi:hypothetical protein